MPELPEVHTIVEDLKQKGLIGQKISSVHVYWPKTIATPDLATFSSLLMGQTIIAIDRRAKFIILHLSNHYFLFIHLRMTGRLLLLDKKAPVSPYTRVIIDLNQQQLHFHDTRKFGRWYLVRDVKNILDRIGPEPLSEAFSLEEFENKIQSCKRALKPLLLDQTFIAGLGNIYVDEALWEAKLHPLQSAHELSLHQIKALYESIRHVLLRGIAFQGTTLGSGKTNFYLLDGSKGNHQNQLNVFRKTGAPCPRCQTPIERIKVAQRGTHFCPLCQKTGTKLNKKNLQC